MGYVRALTQSSFSSPPGWLSALLGSPLGMAHSLRSSAWASLDLPQAPLLGSSPHSPRTLCLCPGLPAVQGSLPVTHASLFTCFDLAATHSLLQQSCLLPKPFQFLAPGGERLQMTSFRRHSLLCSSDSRGPQGRDLTGAGACLVMRVFIRIPHLLNLAGGQCSLACLQ